jgi:hypothetical protein
MLLLDFLIPWQRTGADRRAGGRVTCQVPAPQATRLPGHFRRGECNAADRDAKAQVILFRGNTGPEAVRQPAVHAGGNRDPRCLPGRMAVAEWRKRRWPSSRSGGNGGRDAEREAIPGEPRAPCAAGQVIGARPSPLPIARLMPPNLRRYCRGVRLTLRRKRRLKNAASS